MRTPGHLLALAAFLGAAPATAGVTAAWAVSDGEKVERDDRAHPLKAKNAVWDGRAVRLAAARNEIAAFQVIVEADGAGLVKLSLSLPELRRRGGTETIAYAPPATDPTLSAGRPIQLFSVNYRTSPRRATPTGPGSRGARPRPATPWAGSPSSSCPRTLAPAAAASPSRSRPGSGRRCGSRST